MLELLRLLSPNQRRIFAPTDNSDQNRLTEKLLVGFGWTVYRGTAMTDKRGWVIQGSDPKIQPKPVAPNL